jgi:parallel beta-helix repeat protein
MHRARHLAALALLLIAVVAAAHPALPEPARATTGTTVVSGTLVAAVAAAQPGDVLELQARVYDEAHVEIARAGTAAQPITLRGAGMSQSILSGRITFRPGAAYWVVEDLTVDMTGEDKQDAIRANPGTANLTFRRIAVRDGVMYGIRLEDGVHNVLIEQCEVARFVNSSTDAHGVGLQAVSNVTVRGCYIHHNSGDGVQSHTSDFPGNTLRARNVLIEGNRIENNGENGVDIKSTHGIIVRGNSMAGYRAAGGGEGIAIEVQYDAQDVLISGNRITDAAMGIELTRGRKDGSDYPALPRRVRIAGNLIYGLILDAFANAGNGVGIVLRGCAEVKVLNNTIVSAPTAALYMGRGNNGEFVQGLTAHNNVLGGAANDLNYNSDIDALGGVEFGHNHFVSGRVRGKGLAEWTSQLRDLNSTSGDPSLDGGYFPVSGSPLIDSGANIGLPFTGSAPDRGWHEIASAMLALPTPLPAATIDPRLNKRAFVPLLRR